MRANTSSKAPVALRSSANSACFLRRSARSSALIFDMASIVTACLLQGVEPHPLHTPSDRSLLVVPDNASTASNQISKTDRARDVNVSYGQFLEYYRTAAVPTRSAAPRDKGNVEAGVKVVTNWVIHYLADRVFASLDDLNEAIAARGI